MASAALVVILGLTALVVDVGALVLEKTRLSNACDAAALAAARELPSSTAAELKALRYLEYNGVSPQEAAVTINEDHNSITVEATRTVNYTFARVLGLSSGTVSARSTAVFGAVSSVTGIVPFGIPEQPLVFGQEYQLKAGSHDDYGPGNYGALALEMPGAKSYRNNLMYGYDGVISVGDWVETEPGNMSGPTEEGVKYRISQCPHTPRCTIDNYHRDCPMVMIVPIYDPTVLNGRDKVHIVGFGAFLLKGVEGQGKKSCVTGYFLEMNPPEGLNYTIDPNQTDYGLHGTKLIE
nr:pilus assembly protein TadG-related protein [Desulforadius tongensis]